MNDDEHLFTYLRASGTAFLYAFLKYVLIDFYFLREREREERMR